ITERQERLPGCTRDDRAGPSARSKHGASRVRIGIRNGSPVRFQIADGFSLRAIPRTNRCEQGRCCIRRWFASNYGSQRRPPSGRTTSPAKTHCRAQGAREKETCKLIQAALDFVSTGYSAATHASKPPRNANTRGYLFSERVFATRTLDSSDGHVQ